MSIVQRRRRMMEEAARAAEAAKAAQTSQPQSEDVKEPVAEEAPKKKTKFSRKNKSEDWDTLH